MNNKLFELKQKITEAKEYYYNSGTSPYTDAEYDRMVSQAEKLGYIETVGSKPVKNIPIIKHEHPMLSLDKVHTAEEVRPILMVFSQDWKLAAMDQKVMTLCFMQIPSKIFQRLLIKMGDM